MTGSELQVTLNGKSRALPASTTVSQLLTEVAPQGGRCAVEVNRSIVPRSSQETHVLQHGDVIEIVTFVGGG
ncbi:MAG: thiamine biosynthesis protein ThiS [Pseudohongiellaceae bacterium]|jgi:thiamine biosynthesis protein ThiS